MAALLPAFHKRQSLTVAEFCYSEISVICLLAQAAVCASLLPNVARGGGAHGLMRASSSAGQSARLISVRSEVQILPGPPFRDRASGAAVVAGPWFLRRGCSSVGRAPALQAGGHRFDPVHLHWPATGHLHGLPPVIGAPRGAVAARSARPGICRPGFGRVVRFERHLAKDGLACGAGLGRDAAGCARQAVLIDRVKRVCECDRGGRPRGAPERASGTVRGKVSSGKAAPALVCRGRRGRQPSGQPWGAGRGGSAGACRWARR
jgi:hypothetical protein